jgi:hypothetical protein
MICADFHIALLNLMTYMSWEMPGCINGYIHAKGSDSAAARNFCIEQCDLDESDYLLFIDSDMGFPAWSLQYLLHHEKKVVTGISFQKHEPFQPTIYNRSPTGDLVKICDFEMDKLFRVEATGAAFLLVATDVIKKIGEKYGTKWFEWERERSEDIGFCARIHEAGEEIWADSSVLTSHYTMAPRGIEDFTRIREKQRTGRGKPIVDRKGKTFDPVEFRKSMVIPDPIKAVYKKDTPDSSGVEIIEI